MHMKNKGFSMVELIIVIAIMAVLVGALAPSLIKYVNKARISTDISNGREIAMAIMQCVTDETVKDDAQDHTTQPHNIKDMDGTIFKEAVNKIVALDNLQGKAGKDINGDPLDGNFYYTLDADKNRVQVFCGGTTADYQVYPQAGSKFAE